MTKKCRPNVMQRRPKGGNSGYKSKDMPKAPTKPKKTMYRPQGR